MRDGSIQRTLMVAIGVGMIGVAWGQQSGGVIRGNTNINVNASDVNTVAAGSGNVAKTNIGTVRSSKGDTKMTVDVKGVSNVVTGRGKKGCINIGTKGVDPDCK